MTFTPLDKLLGALVVVLIIAFGVEGWRLGREQRAHAAAALAADTLAAHADTSHAAKLAPNDSAKLLGDSLAAVQRRVVQVVQKNDALDKALKLERISNATLTARVRSLDVRTSSTTAVRVDTVTGDRSADFAVDSTPYHGRVAVSLPATGRGTLSLALSLDSAAIGLRIGCSGANSDGIRSATATAVGPVWLSLTINRVEQSPDLCRSPALAKSDSRGWLRRLFDRVGVSAGYGATLAGTNVHVGPSVVAGFKLWP